MGQLTKITKDNYYSKIAGGYDCLHKAEQEKKLSIIGSHLNLPKHAILLDVGCGTAFSAEFFNCNFVGIEPSYKMLQNAVANGQKAKNVICAAAESLPFKDGIFDAVISVTAIHNFSDVGKGLLEMKRVGKSKGCMFAFSVLKKSAKFGEIETAINQLFFVEKIVEEEKDVVFFCKTNRKL